MTEILLHNYPQSPVAEKVRVAFGIAGIPWASVEIPRLPPKPMLTALTGGYRRTPVMQIGADIFCDSLCILDEIERRRLAGAWPGSRPLLPVGTAAAAHTLARWTDGRLFDLAVKLVLAGAGDGLPADFAADRGRLYLGPDWASALDQARSDLPHLAAQMRRAFAEFDGLLQAGGPWMLGGEPSLADALVWHIVWFVRGRWDRGPALLDEFAALTAWEGRLAALGHGARRPDVAAEDAIAAAAAAEPEVPEGHDPLDPQALVPGIRVSISPDVDGGEQPTEGTVRFASRERLAILRTGAEAGTLAVHFPRAGYRVRRLDG
ncbi:MAG: glutathione S-transferase family protein [Pseudomonadota bacterium]